MNPLASFDGESSHQLLGIGLVLAGLLIAPQILSTYITGVILDAMIVALFVMAFNLLFGYTGLLSFGHAAYYGTGAYLVAIVLSTSIFPGWMQSLLPAMLVAVLGSILVAAVIGLLCVQRGEIYFAMLTLAFSMMLYRFSITWSEVTGGVNGLIISQPTIELGVVSLDALDTQVYYYFTFLIVLLSILFLWRVVNSPYGEILKTIRENPERAEFIGVPVKYYQWSSFVLSGAFAGIAGSLGAIRTFVVTPGSLHWLSSAEPVVIALLGGPTTFIGPLVGTVVFIGLEEVLVDFTSYWQVALGAILIPLVLYAPNGVTGMLFGDSSMTDRIRDAVDQKRQPEDSETISTEER